MRIKSVCVVAGVVGALFVSTTAQAALTGLISTFKTSPLNPKLFICNLYVTFSAPGDNLIAIVGLPAANGAPLSYSTNSVAGFHQETVPIGAQDIPVDATFRGLVPNYIDDTYITIGLEHGYQGTDTMLHVGVLATDAPPGPTDWNLGGPLTSNAAAGGSYFVLPGAAQGVEVGGRVLIAQLVIDINLATTDGLTPRINASVPEITWADADGNSQSTTINFSGTLHIPAPGTLALLGLAGIRRRRR